MFIMSEYHNNGQRDGAVTSYRPKTSATLHVHIGAASSLDVHAYRSEDRVVLEIGESPTRLVLFVDGHDLDRLRALLDEASLDLGRPVPSAAEAAPEAYATGWDAAIAWMEAATGEPFPNTEPVPAMPPGGAS